MCAKLCNTPLTENKIRSTRVHKSPHDILSNDEELDDDASNYFSKHMGSGISKYNKSEAKMRKVSSINDERMHESSDHHVISDNNSEGE